MATKVAVSSGFGDSMHKFTNLGELRDWLNAFSETELEDAECIGTEGFPIQLHWRTVELTDGSSYTQAVFS